MNIVPLEDPARSVAQPTLIALDDCLASVGRTHTTGWRWRKAGWLRTTNIAGRLYLTREAIAEFIRRAESGEFARTHKTPTRIAS